MTIIIGIITIINTANIAIKILFIGKIRVSKFTILFIDKWTKYTKQIDTGKAYKSDFNPNIILSKYNILLNPWGVSPILLKTANSFLLNAILVFIVLNTLVTPINVTKLINPYTSIFIASTILFKSLICSVTFVYWILLFDSVDIWSNILSSLSYFFALSTIYELKLQSA